MELWEQGGVVRRLKSRWSRMMRNRSLMVRDRYHRLRLGNVGFFDGWRAAGIEATVFAQDAFDMACPIRQG